MDIERNNTLLGVNMAGSRLRFVETETESGQVKIVNAAETQLDIPFDFYAIGNDEFIPKFAGAIREALDLREIQADSAAFALERRMVMLKKFMIDRNFSVDERKRHIEWEVEQFLVSSRSEYNIAYEQLGLYSDDLEEVVVVAVRKAVVNYLKEIFASSSLTLKFVDIDLFAAIRALVYGNQNNGKEAAAFVDYGERGVYLCLIKNNNYYNSTEVVPTKEGQDISHLTEVSDLEMAKIISDELYKLVSDSSLQIEVQDLEAIYISGDRVSDEIVSTMEDQQLTSVRIANPFLRQQLSIDPETENQIKEYPEKFLTSFGLALTEK